MRKTLTPDQYIAIQWLAQPKHGGKTREEIANLANVTRQTLYKWERSPDFDRELKAEMQRRNRDRLPELIDSLVDMAIKNNNAAMAKLALQVNGMLVDQVSVEKKEPEKDGIDYDALDDEIESFAKRFDDVN
jgi:transcriptional regulator with XRE-family HTH domain